MLSHNKMDFIGLCETFLDKHDSNSILLGKFLDTYSVFRADRAQGRGGGVLFLSHVTQKPVQVKIPAPFQPCECVAIDTNGADKMRFVCAYRPPGYTLAENVLLFSCLQWLCETSNFPVIIVGDLNLPEFSWENLSHPNTPLYNEFVKFFFQCGLNQFVDSPTRLNNILDVVCCTELMLVCNVSVEAGFSTSDHASILFNVIKSHFCSTNSTNFNGFYFRKMDIVTAKILLACVDWSALFRNCDNVEVMWSKFSEVMNDVFMQSVPLFQPKISKFRYPRHIRKLVNRKLKLYRAWKRLGTFESKLTYRKAALDVKNAIIVLRIAKEKEILSAGITHQFYQYVKTQLKTRYGVPPLKGPDDSIVTTDSDKAEILNQQFASVFIEDNAVLPPILSFTTGSKLLKFFINQEIARKTMCKLRPSFSLTPDGIPNFVLKNLSFELAKPLSLIFSACVDSGCIPNVWKSHLSQLFLKKVTLQSH